MWVASKFCLISAADWCADFFLEITPENSKDAALEDPEDTADCLLVFHLTESENALGLK